MNKKILISNILFSFVLFTHFTNSSAHTKVHDNDIYFTDKAHSVSFTQENYCITPGQPYQIKNGNHVPKTSHGVGIDIKAGRHLSSNVVDCVSDIFMNANVGDPFSSKFTFDHDPDYTPIAFNFAVEGDLTINGTTFKKIILAQGHDAARNNWWFGGINCDNSSDPGNGIEQVNCTATDGTKWCFMRGSTSGDTSTSPDHVKVEKHECY